MPIASLPFEATLGIELDPEAVAAVEAQVLDVYLDSDSWWIEEGGRVAVR